MMKSVKRLFLGLFLVGVLVVVAGVVIVATINPNDYKPQISDAIRDATGYDVALDGDLSLSGFPLTHLQVERMAVSNNGEAFTRADVISVQVNLLPLLQGRIESGGIVVKGMDVTLKRDKSGKGNWETTIKSDDEAAQATAEDDSATVSKEQAAGIALAKVKIENSRVVWIDETAGQTISATITALENDGFAFGETMHVSLRGAVREQPSRMGADLDLSARIVATKDASLRLPQVDVKLHPHLAKTERLPEIRLSGAFIVSPEEQSVEIENSQWHVGDAEIKIAGKVSADQAALTMESNNFNARALLTSLGVALPKFAAKDALRSAQVKTSVTYDDDTLSLRDLQAVVDQSRMTGWVSVGLEATPKIKTSLSVSYADVAKYLPVDEARTSSRGDEKRKQQQASDGISCAALPLRELPMATVNLGINKVKWDDHEINDARIVLVSEKGGLDVTELSMKGFGGEYKGTAKFMAKGKCTAEVTLGGRASRLKVPALMALGGDNDLIEDGLLSANYRLRARGTNQDTLLRALSGKVDVRLDKVKTQDSFLGKGLETAAKLLVPGMEMNKKSLLSPAQVTATLDIKKGNARITQLKGETPLLMIVNDGGNGIDLPGQTLDMKFRVGLLGKQSDTPTLPMTISGKMDDPQVNFDTAALLKGQIEKEGKRAVKKLKKRAKKKIKKELDRVKETLREKPKKELKRLLDKLDLPF